MLMRNRQKGASVIGLIIVLVLIAYGAYVGIQYIPQKIEATTVGTVLSSVKKNHVTNPFKSTSDVQSALNKQLNVNEMNDLKENFIIFQNGSEFTITVSYERELDLGFDKRRIIYERAVILD
jgi:hypothetical protein